MKLKQNIKAIAADLYLGANNLLATSAETGYVKESVLAKIKEVIDLYNAPVETDESDETDETDDEETEE